MVVLINGIDISSLLKSKDVFELFRYDMCTDRDKAGAIRAFEFCFEMAWKTMKRILEKRGVTTNSPRDAIREAAKNNLISSPTQWFEFIDMRNVAYHTYDQENVEKVLSIFDTFSHNVDELSFNLKQLE